jgi:hypothetical protein
MKYKKLAEYNYQSKLDKKRITTFYKIKTLEFKIVNYENNDKPLKKEDYKKLRELKELYQNQFKKFKKYGRK